MDDNSSILEIIAHLSEGTVKLARAVKDLVGRVEAIENQLREIHAAKEGDNATTKEQ